MIQRKGIQEFLVWATVRSDLKKCDNLLIKVQAKPFSAGLNLAYRSLKEKKTFSGFIAAEGCLISSFYHSKELYEFGLAREFNTV